MFKTILYKSFCQPRPGVRVLLRPGQAKQEGTCISCTQVAEPAIDGGVFASNINLPAKEKDNRP